jgi:glycosyltransferase involved in cell wall biosynthesis
MKPTKVVALLEARVVTGPAKNLLRFATGCRDRVDLTIVTFIRTKRNESKVASTNQFISAARDLGVSVEVVTETSPFDLSVLSKLAGIFHDRQADIVETHGIKSHFLLSLLRRKSYRWLAFHHGYTTEDLKMRLYCEFDRWSLRRPDLVVTVCQQFAEMLASRGVSRERIVVIPNAVRIEAAEAANASLLRRDLGITAEHLVVLVIGRLSPEKGHRYLIDAISLVASQLPLGNLVVLIAGAGPTEKQLRERVEKRQLATQVKFIGYRTDVRALLSIANLFVLPSLSEGSPNALLESMAANVPILATKVGGVPELVQDGESAFLVPPASESLLAKSMAELLLDPSRAKQLARAAFDRARLLFGPARYDQRVLQAYAKVLETLPC